MINNLEKFGHDCHVPTTTMESYAKMVNGYLSPTIIEERKLNVASMDVFSRLFMDRIIWLPTAINEDVANIISAQIMCLESTNDVEPINLYINSPGGEVTHGLLIYDTMNLIKCPVYTTCAGQAASMGAVLLSSGEKGHRFALPHGRIMIHQVAGGAEGKSADVRIAVKEMEKCEKVLFDILAENTGKTVEENAFACDRDHWFSATEAVDFGLIDEVIKKK